MPPPPRLRLRLAEESDARLLWRWANDRAVRAASLHPAPIPWQTHLRWLRARLARPASRLYVAWSPQAGPLGQIRFDRTGPDRAEIDVSVARRWRGLGLGRRLLRLAAPRAARELRVRRLRAAVRPGNASSRALFQAAGFTRLRDVRRRGRPCLLFELRVAP